MNGQNNVYAINCLPLKLFPKKLAEIAIIGQILRFGL